MIVLDNNALVFLYRPTDNQFNQSEKMKYIFEQQKAKKGVFGIPAPVLAEFLIGEPNIARRQEFLSFFSGKNKVFQLLPFDLKSATLCAIIADRLNSLPNEGQKEPRQKIKVDRQIIAIAMSNGVKQLISSDHGLIKSAQNLSCPVLNLDEMSIPEKTQPDLFLN